MDKQFITYSETEFSYYRFYENIKCESVLKPGAKMSLAAALKAYCCEHTVISDEHFNSLRAPLFTHLDFGSWTTRGHWAESL